MSWSEPWEGTSPALSDCGNWVQARRPLTSIPKKSPSSDKGEGTGLLDPQSRSPEKPTGRTMYNTRDEVVTGIRQGNSGRKFSAGRTH